MLMIEGPIVNFFDYFTAQSLAKKSKELFSLVSKINSSVKLFLVRPRRMTIRKEPLRRVSVEKAKMEKFKNILLQHKVRIMSGGILRSNEDLTVSPDDLPDEADLAMSVINQQVTFNMRQRELFKLKQIDEALYRIEQGQYGHCEECDEEIGDKRLENQPWTTLCITHAEEQERENQKFIKAV
jgi:DnaK suppressor protein